MDDDDLDQWIADNPEEMTDFYFGEPVHTPEPGFDHDWQPDLGEWTEVPTADRNRPAGSRIERGSPPTRRRPLDSPFVYQLSCIENLCGIVENGRLRPSGGRSIGNRELTEKRASYQVATSRGRWVEVRNLNCFYLTPRSPMLYSLLVDPEENTPPPGELVILRARAISLALDYEFAFTDGHSVSRKTRSYADLAHLGAIDFEEIRRRYWESLTRRQAEFMVADDVPLTSINAIGVPNAKAKARVTQILPNGPAVVLTPHSFFR